MDLGRHSQTKQLAFHGLIIAYISVASSIVVSILSLILVGSIPELAGTMFLGGLGFFGAGIGCKASKGIVVSKTRIARDKNRGRGKC